MRLIALFIYSFYFWRRKGSCTFAPLWMCISGFKVTLGPCRQMGHNLALMGRIIPAPQTKTPIRTASALSLLGSHAGKGFFFFAGRGSARALLSPFNEVRTHGWSVKWLHHCTPCFLHNREMQQLYNHPPFGAKVLLEVVIHYLIILQRSRSSRVALIQVFVVSQPKIHW